MNITNFIRNLPEILGGDDTFRHIHWGWDYSETKTIQRYYKKILETTAQHSPQRHRNSKQNLGQIESNKQKKGFFQACKVF